MREPEIDATERHSRSCSERSWYCLSCHALKLLNHPEVGAGRVWGGGGVETWKHVLLGDYTTFLTSLCSNSAKNKVSDSDSSQHLTSLHIYREPAYHILWAKVHKDMRSHGPAIIEEGKRL